MLRELRETARVTVLTWVQSLSRALLTISQTDATIVRHRKLLSTLDCFKASCSRYTPVLRPQRTIIWISYSSTTVPTHKGFKNHEYLSIKNIKFERGVSLSFDVMTFQLPSAIRFSLLL